MTIHRWKVLLVACAASISLVGSTFAAQHDEEKARGGAAPGIVAGEKVVVTATVKAVDKKTRHVTLEGPEGNTVVVKAGPEIKNFDQIDVGDKLVIEYSESVAIAIDPAGAAPAAGAQVAMETAPLGAKPAMVAETTVELRAKILDVDKSARKVTIQGPGGNKRVFKVAKDVKRFDAIKAGDDVVIRYTEAVAAKVTKP